MKNYPLILLAVLALGSCSKIIDIELNTAMQRIVIEARITDEGGPARVILSRTTDYFNPNEPEKVTGAAVSLRSDVGETEILQEVSPGIYQSNEMIGVSGRSYYLKVEDGDQVYEATALLPTKVLIDSLEVRFMDSIQDLQTEFRNSMRILANDALFNGRQSFINLNRMGFYNLGDTIQVELVSIDEEVYNYFDQLNEISSGGAGFSSSAPANPKNNLTNGAMGYFTAEAVDRKVRIVR